jgi:endonuclease III
MVEGRILKCWCFLRKMDKRRDLPVISQKIKKRNDFLRILDKVEKKYGKSSKRLAGDYVQWGADWKVLITTILSAQSRDETTIPIAEKLFRKYGSLKKLAGAKYTGVLQVLKSMNYNKTKSKHVIAAAKFILKEFEGNVPDSIEELVRIPGVGRKTANLVVTEVYRGEGICVDTHVHRLSNVFGFVDTKVPNQTEKALRELVPKKYWSRINRLFVLWGKDASGRDKDKLLRRLEER